MLMIPLWSNRPNHQTDIWDSLTVLLGGYAFERQGRRSDYFYAAVDSLFDCRQHNNGQLVDQTILLLWQAFSQRLNNINLNAKNNPLYPSTNPDNIEGLADSPSLLEVVLQNNLQQVSLTDHLNSQIQENNNVQPAFQLISAVRGIGGKIASFFLRDLVIIYQLDLSPVNGRYLLQPIDVWVQRTISQLANIPANQKQRIAEWIVETSIQHNVNPELVNMGVWFFCSTIVVSAYRLQSILSDLQLAQQLAHHYSLKVASTNERCQNFA